MLLAALSRRERKAVGRPATLPNRGPQKRLSRGSTREVRFETHAVFDHLPPCKWGFFCSIVRG